MLRKLINDWMNEDIDRIEAKANIIMRELNLKKEVKLLINDGIFTRIYEEIGLSLDFRGFRMSPLINTNNYNNHPFLPLEIPYEEIMNKAISLQFKLLKPIKMKTHEESSIYKSKKVADFITKVKDTFNDYLRASYLVATDLQMWWPEDEEEEYPFTEDDNILVNLHVYFSLKKDYTYIENLINKKKNEPGQIK